MNDIIMTDHSSTNFFALLLFFPLGCFGFLILICMGSLYIMDIYCIIACVEIFTSSVAFKFCDVFNNKIKFDQLWQIAYSKNSHSLIACPMGASKTSLLPHLGVKPLSLAPEIEKDFVLP